MVNETKVNLACGESFTSTCVLWMLILGCARVGSGFVCTHSCSLKPKGMHSH